MLIKQGLLALSVCSLIGCATEQSSRPSLASTLAEVQSRPLTFAKYPEAGKTYLSFTQIHGYQVTYVAPGGNNWLWYPGNQGALSGNWKVDTTRNAVCWRYGQNTYNPATNTKGGSFNCTDRTLAQKTTIAELSGDPFNLKSGAVPYVGQKCAAPDQFKFDRNRYSCK